MSVKVIDRSESKTEYIEQTRKLALEIGRIVANKPKKYKENYGDHLIKCSLEALEYVQSANSVYLTKNTSQIDKNFRHECLIRAKAKIKHISTANYIFLELCKKEDGVSNEKIVKAEARVGEMCAEITKLISGVIKSDAKIG